MRTVLSICLSVIVLVSSAFALTDKTSIEVEELLLNQREEALLVEAIRGRPKAGAMQEYQNMLGKVQDLLKRYPRSGYLFTLEGVLHYTLGDSSTAMTSFDKAKEYDWDISPFDKKGDEEESATLLRYYWHYFRGVIFLGQGSYDQAVEEFSYIVDEISPKMPGWGEIYQVKNYLSFAYGQIDELEKAYNTFLSILDDEAMLKDEYYGEQIDYAMQYALAILGVEKPPKPLSELNATLQKDPENNGARIERAEMLYEVGAMTVFTSEMQIISERTNNGESLSSDLRATYDELVSFLEDTQ